MSLLASIVTSGKGTSDISQYAIQWQHLLVSCYQNYKQPLQPSPAHLLNKHYMPAEPVTRSCAQTDTAIVLTLWQ